MLTDLMPLWAWWVLGAVALVLADVSLLGAQFLLIPMALAALTVAGLAALDASLATQLWVFGGATVGLTPLLILLFRPRFAARPLERDWMVGREACLVWQGDRLVARLKSDTYPFRFPDQTEPEPGACYTVTGMEGITLLLRGPARPTPHTGDSP